MDIDLLRIETPRLILRPPRLEDLDAWAEMITDELSARFIGGVMPRPISWRQLMTVIGSWHAHGFAMFSVIERSSGRWIGRLGPWMPEGWPGPEIGWAIARDCWGRGYAGEGASAATNWALSISAGRTSSIRSRRRTSRPSAWRRSSVRATSGQANYQRRSNTTRSICGDRRAKNGISVAPEVVLIGDQEIGA